MCGIAGILGLPQDLAERIAPRMAAAIAHRGPDDCGRQVITDPRGGFAGILLHARLAIIDLTETGRQPMCDRPSDGSLANCVVFNGEVFNYQQCWEPLARAGWPCRSLSDTEVILHGYRVWGEACVARFRGMFAWCLVDSARGIAWFCRDRLGIKPLYLYRPAQGGLLFASEVRALLAAGDGVVARKLDSAAVESFLAQGAVMSEHAIVRGVRLIRPGESLITDLSGTEIRRRTYWQLPVHEPALRSSARIARDEAIKLLGSTLREAVKLRLISDVPLGLFLSGGIDSAALVTLATEVSTSRIVTVNVGYDQPEYDESSAAAAISEELGTDHVSLKLTGEGVLHDLPGALAAMDQPTVDGFNVFFVSRAAKRAGLTVALSGLGGDELFGGYASFRDVPRAASIQRWLRLVPGARGATELLAKWNRRSTIKAAEVLRRDRSLAQMYLLRRELFLTPQRRRLFSGVPEHSDSASGVSRELLDELLAIEALCWTDPVNAVSRFEICGYMRHMLLRDADVFSMVHALELRVPLLDHRVVELAVTLPGAWKRQDPRPKPLLIDAVGRRLPNATYRAAKRGFTLPWRPWFAGPLRERAERAANNGDIWEAIGFDALAVRELWRSFDHGSQRVAATQILALLVLEDYTVRNGLTLRADP